MASNKTNFVLVFTLLAIISTLTLPLINARELSTSTQSYDEVKYKSTVGATDKGVVPDRLCYYVRGHRVCTPPASPTPP